MANSGPEIFFAASALAPMAVGDRHPRAVALDNQPQRLPCPLDDEKHEIGQFFLDPRGLVFSDPRQQLLCGHKVAATCSGDHAADRFDDRRVGAFEFPRPQIPRLKYGLMQKQPIIGQRRKFLINPRDSVGTALTAAFRMAQTTLPKRPAIPADRAFPTACAIRLMAETGRCSRPDMPSFPPCVRRAVDGIFRPGGGRSKTNSKASWRTCRLEKISHPRWGVATMADGGNLIGR